ncbi:M24 family metallopeptidase [Simkania negevensis]|uniref:M24 family metallopeptidase n=1 Tax=Simkania negevensis TaxID=83561 RepID=A0ABS3ASJ1_9BACT|nr:M24 family metallopeptidase [Simkania negevensis]
MELNQKIKEARECLVQEGIDGWLFYDFRGNNEIACQFLNIDKAHRTRRWFYWLPVVGEPVKILHAIEQKPLSHLPGEKLVYNSWQQLDHHLSSLLTGRKKVAMEYSPNNAIPYVSKVDGGTVDAVRKCGVEVVSSAQIMQYYQQFWDEKTLQSHLFAADLVDTIAADSWALIKGHLESGKTINEYDVHKFIEEQFEANNCYSDGSPICAVNAHAADPHYVPTAKGALLIKKGDFVLIDLWCRHKDPGSAFADIARVAVADVEPTQKHQEVFNVVKHARLAGVDLIKARYKEGRAVQGWEVDQVCRQIISDAGYGEFFTHRTGHNIGIEGNHGDGTHLDNFETQDFRYLLPGTCCSVEPGIYLPGEFGVRLEFDLVITRDKTIRITGGIQDEIVTLL